MLLRHRTQHARLIPSGRPARPVPREALSAPTRRLPPPRAWSSRSPRGSRFRLPRTPRPGPAGARASRCPRTSLLDRRGTGGRRGRRRGRSAPAPPASGVETEMPFMFASAPGVMPSPRAIRYSVSPAATRCVPGAGADGRRRRGAGRSPTRSGSACAGASTTRGPSGVMRRGAGRSSVRSEVRWPGRSPLAGVPQPAATTATRQTRSTPRACAAERPRPPRSGLGGPRNQGTRLQWTGVPRNPEDIRFSPTPCARSHPPASAPAPPSAGDRSGRACSGVTEISCSSEHRVAVAARACPRAEYSVPPIQ